MTKKRIESARKDLRAQAYKIITLSIEEAKCLPNLLGKIVPYQLQTFGYYARTWEGKITFYEVRN